jgi:serine/threonine protein kinase
MNLINNKYLLIDKIGSGSFGSIYRGQNVRTKEFVAIKVEPIIDDLKLLKNESNIYNFLSGLEGIPTIKWYGKDNKNYYMVINLLGKSLRDLIDESKKISLLLTLKFGIKIIIILKLIHDKGLVHRDIKPDNFLFGLNGQFNHIYLIDFGFCKSYILPNGDHKEMKKTNNIIGSYNYASIMSHKRVELSRRDDLESLFYLLLYLCSGTLPWSNITNEKEIIVLKYNIINEDKNEYPKILIDSLKYVRTMEFEEKPNYYLIIDNFKREIEVLSKNNLKQIFN